jgi:hypothetical protein
MRRKWQKGTIRSEAQELKVLLVGLHSRIGAHDSPASVAELNTDTGVELKKLWY